MSGVVLAPTPGTRGRLTIGLWLAAFLAVVGVALVGRVLGPEEPATRAAVAPAEPPEVRPTAAAPVRPPVDIVVLTSPAMANAVITSRDLSVRGYLVSGTGTIRVTLEARGNRIIDEATIEPALAFAERPTTGRHPQFEASFGLPNPRPNGRMIVQVALLDDRGQILDVVRRPFRVGPLVEVAKT